MTNCNRACPTIDGQTFHSFECRVSTCNETLGRIRQLTEEWLGSASPAVAECGAALDLILGQHFRKTDTSASNWPGFVVGSEEEGCHE